MLTYHKIFNVQANLTHSAMAISLYFLHAVFYLQPVAERLDEYLPEDPKIMSRKLSLIKSPPEMQPIPCKPLFYDLAANHVQFPDVSSKITTQEKKTGISGYMRSWIGGWGGKK